MSLNNLSDLNPLTLRLLQDLESYGDSQAIDDKKLEANVIRIFNTQINIFDTELENETLSKSLCDVIENLKNINPDLLEKKSKFAIILPKVRSVVESLLCVKTDSSAFFTNANLIPMIAEANHSGLKRTSVLRLAEHELTDPKAQSMLQEYLTKKALRGFDPFKSNEAYQRTMKLREFARLFCMDELQTLIESYLIENLPYNLPIQDLQTLYHDLDFWGELSELRITLETELASAILNSNEEISEDLALIANEIASINLYNLQGYEESKLETILDRFPNLKQVVVPELSQQGIELISERCKGLIQLATAKSTFSTLPQELASSIQELTITQNDNLQTIDVPQATKVSCNRCQALTSFKAPKAIRVDCYNCPNLTSLQAPQAIRVNCNHCKALTSLHAPKTTEVDCFYCTALPSLYVPEATKVDCSYCSALTSLYAPKAITVNCSYCTTLPSLNAPEAETVDCSHCTTLALLDAPKAIKVDCSHCTALTSLHVPKALTVLCTSCRVLPALDAPKATKVDCSHCTALTSLYASRAFLVDCKYCPALNSIDAPKAAKVNCSHCPDFISINAPLAEIIRQQQN